MLASSFPGPRRRGVSGLGTRLDTELLHKHTHRLLPCSIGSRSPTNTHTHTHTHRLPHCSIGSPTGPVPRVYPVPQRAFNHHQPGHARSCGAGVCGREGKGQLRREVKSQLTLTSTAQPFLTISPHALPPAPTRCVTRGTLLISGGPFGGACFPWQLARR